MTQTERAASHVLHLILIKWESIFAHCWLKVLSSILIYPHVLVDCADPAGSSVKVLLIPLLVISYLLFWRRHLFFYSSFSISIILFAFLVLKCLTHLFVF